MQTVLRRSGYAMNYIYSKSRNRMSYETTDNPQFIYINTQTLWKPQEHEPTGEELLAI